MTSRRIQKSIYNQLQVSSPSAHLSPDLNNKSLNLRGTNFILAPALSEVLAQSKPHASQISQLDISYSMANGSTINSLCRHFVNLKILHAKSCGLKMSDDISWPKYLTDLDLSRNKLEACPEGITRLMYLTYLNLSGNVIHNIPSALLQIPSLKQCLLLNNPLMNIPKEICREGVGRMRSYLNVEPLPMPHTLEENRRPRIKRTSSISVSSLENCGDLRRYILSHQGSVESGYESNRRTISSGSTSSMPTDIEFSETSDTESEFGSAEFVPWRKFNPDEVPNGYTEQKSTQLFKVYIPDNCVSDIEICEVKDISLHPILKDNELLVTPVIRVTPHGLTFPSKPAIIVLSHCAKNNHSIAMNLIPMCSNTKQYQTTKWLPLNPKCEIFEDRIMFSTHHFSLFAGIISYPYPSASCTVQPNMSADLSIPELPGFNLHIPSGSIGNQGGAVDIKGTAYYCDRSYRVSNDNAPASACIGIEPHGMEFDCPVQVSIPIPHYAEIKARFPELVLTLWYSQRSASNPDVPTDWNQVEDIDFKLEDDAGANKHHIVAKFTTDHFSWYEFLWSICTAPLQKLGLGAASLYNQLSSRSKYISIRFQAFMSNPHGPSLTFGLVVLVYKFGDPLVPPGNYPLLVADSGAKRLHLRIGDLHVRIEGLFSANESVGEKLESDGKIVNFIGEDFCERFEFVLNLKSDVPLPLQEGQVLGKVRFIQWEETNPIYKSFNLIMVSCIFKDPLFMILLILLLCANS